MNEEGATNHHANAGKLGHTKPVEFPPKSKAGEILFLMDSQRHDGAFCDVQLKLSASKTVYAHKAVLASCSAYFESMFTCSFMEASSKVIDLSQTTENLEVLEKVINSFYGEPFEICSNNVGEILNLATMFLMDDLKSVCATVLYSMVNVGMAAEIFLLSTNYGMTGLAKTILPIFECRFHDCLMYQVEILEFNPAQLKLCLNTANLDDISRPSDYLDMLLRWFCYDKSDERADCLITLLHEMPFEVTPAIYKDNEKEILGIIKHLFSAIPDLSVGKAEELRAELDSLRPADNVQVSQDCQQTEEKDEEGVRLIFADSTPDEQKMQIKEVLDLQLEQTIVGHDEKVMKIPDMVNIIIVIAPGLDYFEKVTGSGWSFDIVCFLPFMNTWYKLGTCDANITNKVGKPCQKTNVEPYKSVYLADFQCSYSNLSVDMSFMDLDESDFCDFGENSSFMTMDFGFRSNYKTSKRRNLTQLPPLHNKKWGVAYLNHKLYFFHQDFCENVFTYDLIQESCSQSGFNAVEDWNGDPITAEGIELIVLGMRLYAVVRLVVYDMKHRDHHKSTATVLHKIYEYHEQTESWSLCYTTKEHDACIPIDVDLKSRSNGVLSHDPGASFEEIPKMRQPGTFRTVLFSEDEEKINIILMVKMYNQKPEVYCFSHVSLVNLNKKSEDESAGIHFNQRFIRQPTPLSHGDHFFFVNDDLQVVSLYQAANQYSKASFYDLVNSTVNEKTSMFLEAEESHPVRPALMTSDPDGQRMWILEGDTNSISSLSECTITRPSPGGKMNLKQIPRSPPPFCKFSMACTGRLDRNLMKTFPLPTKYLHPQHF